MHEAITSAALVRAACAFVAGQAATGLPITYRIAGPGQLQLAVVRRAGAAGCQGPDTRSQASRRARLRARSQQDATEGSAGQETHVRG